MVVSPPWWPDTLHCPEYCTDKPSTKRILNFRWVLYFHPKFIWYLARELRTVALSSVLNNLFIPFLTAAAGLSYQHHPVFMVLQMCVLGYVVLMSLKCINLRMLQICPRKEWNQQVGWLPPGFVRKAVSHWASIQYQLVWKVQIQYFFCAVMGCHTFPLEITSLKYCP